MIPLRTLVGAVCLVALTSAPSAHAHSILVDESHGQFQPLTTDPLFSMARTALANAGHTLTATTGAITAGALAGHDVFFTSTLNGPSYSAAEIAALQTFVTGGGGVIVNHDGGFSSDSHVGGINSFLAPYGMVMSGFSTFAAGLVLSDWVSHCLTMGVSTIGMDFVRELTTVSAPALDLNAGSLDMLAVYDDVGGGWVITFGDDTLWRNPATSDFDITDHDNERLLTNIFGYRGCGPTAIEASTWGAIKGIYR